MPLPEPADNRKVTPELRLPRDSGEILALENRAESLMLSTDIGAVGEGQDHWDEETKADSQKRGPYLFWNISPYHLQSDSNMPGLLQTSCH